MPRPAGTGFFVSPDGWFVTAAHVVLQDDCNPKPDINGSWLMKEGRNRDGLVAGAMCQSVSLEFVDRATDFALFKVDFEKNRSKEWLTGRNEFPFLRVSSRALEEAEPVYSFGYPLGEAKLTKDSPDIKVGHVAHRPRVTSAIVASDFEEARMIMTDRDVVTYVLDKALNYGNSGGPIVSVETGDVHAFCSRFQPVVIPRVTYGMRKDSRFPSSFQASTAWSLAFRTQLFLNSSGIEAFRCSTRNMPGPKSR